ncbi:MAG: hypothetical protein IJ774_05775 [Selenomonadaceae bacterium]|nr:hypothetical protein [Selenomonadaceae bacterium]MBR1805884.1 hypothetical protein [Selenomonadaceae bacterium]
MKTKGGYTHEEYEKMMLELKRRYSVVGEKDFEYRGRFGRAALFHDNDTGEEYWRGKEARSNFRFRGDTLEEVEADFHSLVDGLIDELGEDGEPKNG